MATPEKSTAFATLAGQRIVVTGGSTGIGRAIAYAVAQAQGDVILHFRQSRGAAEQTASRIRELGSRCELLQADLGDPQQLPVFAARAWEVWAGVDGWVNNAGVDLLTGPGASLEYAEKLVRLLDVDVRATVLLSREIGKRMQAQGSGVLLNIGWDQADRGMGGESGELFATAKNAIMGFTRSLAVSLAPQVRVNCIAPGWIQTSWGEQASDYWQQRVIAETPLARWGTPEDVARLARFLLSDAASFITGQVINANGGAVR
ncbi:MAG: SDR family oxidoreductase [Planctomycetaceae bacterium]|nr:SDR family oxidoreductase [Planctomycetaceae bacterium]